MAVNKSKEATINWLTSLNRIAWRQVEHSAGKLAEDTEGFAKTLQILDVVFRYDGRVEAPRALDKSFWPLVANHSRRLFLLCR